MNEFSTNLLFPIFHVVFGAIMVLSGIRVLKPFKNEEKFNKIKVFLIIGGLILFLGGIFELSW